MEQCVFDKYCRDFHKDRTAGFICFNPIFCLSNLCDVFKGSGKRVKPQAIKISKKDLEESIRKNKKRKKEIRKHIRKKYKNQGRGI